MRACRAPYPQTDNSSALVYSLESSLSVAFYSAPFMRANGTCSAPRGDTVLACDSLSAPPCGFLATIASRHQRRQPWRLTIARALQMQNAQGAKVLRDLFLKVGPAPIDEPEDPRNIPFQLSPEQLPSHPEVGELVKLAMQNVGQTMTAENLRQAQALLDAQRSQ